MMNSEQLTETYKDYNQALINGNRTEALRKNQELYDDSFKGYMATTGQKKQECLADMENLMILAEQISWTTQLNNPEETA